MIEISEHSSNLNPVMPNARITQWQLNTYYDGLEALQIIILIIDG